MNKLLMACLLLLFTATSFAQSTKTNAPLNVKRERLSLDKGWQFHLGDIAFPVIKGHDPSYQNAKAGIAWGAAAPAYDDKQWRTINLPHDWAVEGGFDSAENLSQGYRKRGFGWYRRYFKIPPSDRGKNLQLMFDGIATHSTVWLNGTIIARNFCGYTSFYVDITAMAKYGDDPNVISIRVDANAMEGWWYEGAGMYRHTWLVKQSPVHIMADGVYAHPVKKAAGWILPVEVTLENTAMQAAPVEIEVTLFDKTGKKVGQEKTTDTAKPFYKVPVNLSMQVANPQLWSIENPTMYRVLTVVKQNGAVSDSIASYCGFRTTRFDADSGFYLNDKRIKIKGVCNHQDHAGVGVAVPDALWEFRLRKLKEMGANGYRCAHNPPSTEFLDACDRIGILVMDENRNFNSTPDYLRQLEWLVRRDRNHPSVILWSVFNEEPMQGTETGYQMVRVMNAEVKKLDTTRPVTAAMSGGIFTSLNVSKAVDVMGFNYQQGGYDRFHKENPAQPMTSSEDVSGLMVRGEYINDRQKHLLESYDTQKPGWGSTHRTAWKMVAERPFVAGCFVWTGFDYRGEPTPFQWPTAGSNFGIMDLCGFPKMAYYLHQAQWIDSRPILQLVPHWNWPGKEGKPIKVMAMSNTDSVQLLLNGQPVGGQAVDKYEMNTWNIPYKPGTLEAIGFKNGKEVIRFKQETTGEPASLQLIPDRNYIVGDGADAMPVTIQVLDAKGRAVPTANLAVEFALTGKGSIIGLGNGDPNSHEPEKGNKRSLFNGLAQVIIQSMDSATGKIELTATSPGLKPAVISINVNRAASTPFVPVVHPILVLDKWVVAVASAARPDPSKEPESNDMNSLQPTKPGQLQTMTDGTFLLYRTSFKPYAAQQSEGGNIIFRKLTGKAEVWLDGKLAGTKSTAAAADFTVPFPPMNGERKLVVLIESDKGSKAGLGGVVNVLTENVLTENR